MPTIALQDKNPRLARPFAHSLNSRLSPVMRSSRQTTLFGKKLSFHIPFSPYYIYTLVPTKCRELLERFLREKPLRKTRLIHPQSSHRDSSNSSTIFLSIVKSLRGTLPKPLLTVPISVRRLLGALGSS